MESMNRRDFIRNSAGVLVAASMLDALPVRAEGPPTLSAAAQPRTLGKSGITCTRLGFGTGTRAWNKNSAQIRKGREVFLDALAHAYDRGVRYFDLADMYGSHEYLRDAAAASDMKRSEMMILTKLTVSTADQMRDDLRRTLAELNTDYLDVVLMHCMTTGDWPEQHAACMDVLREAKDTGIIKAKGVSCHHLHALQAAAKHEWVDILLARINPFGTLMDGTEEEIRGVLGEAKSNGKGVIGMKILGEGKHQDKKQECLRFAMSLDCIDAFTIGFLESREVDEILDIMDACAKG